MSELDSNLRKIEELVAPLRTLSHDADIIHIHSVYLWPGWRAGRAL